jgi:hypothetical protein
MINWYNLIVNALWVMGCATALATFSYVSWFSSVNRTKFWDGLKSRQIQLSLYLAGFLFSIGMAGTSDSIYEEAAWIVFCIFFLVQGGILIFRKSTP